MHAFVKCSISKRNKLIGVSAKDEKNHGLVGGAWLVG